MREAISAGQLGPFVRKFLGDMYPARDVPQWVVDAVAGCAGIDLSGVVDATPAPYVPPPTYEEYVARGEIVPRDPWEGFDPAERPPPAP